MMCRSERSVTKLPHTMNVSQLIIELQKMPQDSEVRMIWDGASRSEVDYVWRAQSGAVILCECEDMVYYDNDRPESAPSAKENPFWRPGN